MTTKIYQTLARQFTRKLNILNGDLPASWTDERHANMLADCDDKIQALLDHAPHGGGFDSGIQFLEDDSSPNKLVFRCDFHHMDEHGYYNGWSEHKAIVTPDLAFGYNLKITGRNRDQIKEFISETLGYWLDTLWANQ
jgi:hypothetical protein